MPFLFVVDAHTESHVSPVCLSPFVKFTQDTPVSRRLDIIQPPAMVANTSPCASFHHLELLFGLCRSASVTDHHGFSLHATEGEIKACLRLSVVAIRLDT